MVNRLPAWIFLSIAMLLIGLALLPVIRLILGIDAVIGIQPLTMIMLLIGGLMCGLSAMILLVRRQPPINQYSNIEVGVINEKSTVTKIHSSGLLLFSGLPLANFLVAYYLWTSHRHKSQLIDQQGQEALNFQITIYLYLMLALFLVFPVVIGLFFIPLVLILHLTLTLYAIFNSLSGSPAIYPINIPIIQGRPKKIIDTN